MMHMTKLFASLSLVLLLGTTAARAFTPTLIESAPGGKRLLSLDEKTVTPTATGKIALYIQDKDLLANIHDPAVLVVDDHDVRHTPTGVVLATFDGDDIRHGRNGKVMMNYHHPDLCPDARSNRVYTVNGPELTKQQLVAVLYLLRPEMFKLTADEEAAQKKEMAENAAESDREAAADHVAGKWMVLNASGPVEKIGKGSITFAPKTGDVYPVTLDYTGDGGPSFTGVATAGKEMSGEQPIWAAYGTPKSIGLCVYEIDGGSLDGKWYPWYGDGSAKNVGTESLAGPATLDGEYKITAAKAPATGAAYAGTVLIKPLKITGANDDAQPYLLTWTLGTVKVYGIGIRTGKRLYVASGAGADTIIARFSLHNGSFNGDFYKLGSMEQGSTAATSMN